MGSKYFKLVESLAGTRVVKKNNSETKQSKEQTCAFASGVRYAHHRRQWCSAPGPMLSQLHKFDERHAVFRSDARLLEVR